VEARIAKTIGALAEYYDKKLTALQIAMYVEDLSALTPEQLNLAVKKYRTDPANVFFPLPAKLIALAEHADGRPGNEEAWSMVPRKDEQASYVNNEIMGAWRSASDVLANGGDMVSARMTFKEVYDRSVKENRLNGTSPDWFLTRASGRGSEHTNENALRVAVEKGRLKEEKALMLLPTYSLNKLSALAMTKAALQPFDQ
jgi:hypothetical protein